MLTVPVINTPAASAWPRAPSAGLSRALELGGWDRVPVGDDCWDQVWGGVSALDGEGGIPVRASRFTGWRFRNSREGTGVSKPGGWRCLGRQDWEATRQGHTQRLAPILRTTRGL